MRRRFGGLNGLAGGFGRVKGIADQLPTEDELALAAAVADNAGIARCMYRNLAGLEAFVERWLPVFRRRAER